MRYEIILASEAVEDLRRLSARDRSRIRDLIERHLRYRPRKVSRSSIKRLRGIDRPQYRLRVGEIRMFYGVDEDSVAILAIDSKSQANAWLGQFGGEK